ncbi:MAG: zinc ribbon domain-containing protein [Bacteroidota bacterium]
MTPEKFCQSCSMPIDNPADRGTEKNGSKNDQYCKYCYRDGAFILPEMTLEEMKNTVITQMKKRNIPENIIQRSLNILPHLTRWQSSGSVAR